MKYKVLSGLIAITAAICIMYLFSGCAAHELTTAYHELQLVDAHTSNSVPVWPPPPQTPRIMYVKSISSPIDIGARKSWLKRTIDTIFGKEELEGIVLRPYGVFVHSEKIYLTDPGIHVVHIFDLKKKRYLSIKDSQGEEFVSPIGIVVDKNEDIYITDSMLKRVFMFDKEGKYVKDIGSPELFMRPTGIALDEERIYIIDTHAHRVVVFAKKDGKFLFSFGKNGAGKGDFNYPTHIFISTDKRVYITDSMNFRIQIFDRDGNFLSSFGKHGDGSGDFSKPKGIAVDSDGHIYVVDADFDVVQIFDGDGRLLLAFGNSGTEKGKLFLPAGVFTDEKDMIYVADSYNNRIQIFQYIKETTSVPK